MSLLIDTNILSELRRIKNNKCDIGVQKWYEQVINTHQHLYVSIISIGELWSGVHHCRKRDSQQAKVLENWLLTLEKTYHNHILGIDTDVIKVWSTILWPRDQHPIDKLIAATALVYRLTVVSRNIDDFVSTGVDVYCPFSNVVPAQP